MPDVGPDGPGGAVPDGELVHDEEYHSGLDSRREQRERILALLYEAEAKSVSPAELLGELPLDPEPFVAEIVGGVGERRDEIDGLLRDTTRNWSLERMPAIDRALLRVAVYELLACPDTPTAVILNEAVALAKHYSTEDSGKFVNGLLSGVAKKVR